MEMLSDGDIIVSELGSRGLELWFFARLVLRDMATKKQPPTEFFEWWDYEKRSRTTSEVFNRIVSMFPTVSGFVAVAVVPGSRDAERAVDADFSLSLAEAYLAC